jgi:cyclophilin family peptidyl-prolyl cis-trans isomerase
MYAFQTGDMALISLAANAVLELPQLEMEVYKKHLKFFDSLLYSLHLPRQIETYNDLQRLISSIESEPFEKRKLDFNHPIDWAFVKTVPQDLKVRIETSKGAIIIGCKVNEAPGSVANFLKLVDSGYYDQKYFHRVVPDFVIQGGCPRGDGWGSLNWSQRSEFSNFLHYGAGAVGLANAGRDTEGVQFFITHCSTPHLDGRYTIFAYVLEGMDVVRRIEVGDQIISISRINVNA